MEIGKHITRFSTQFDYEAAKYDLDYPNVSKIELDGGLVYAETKPERVHEYVEIAGIKWATCNVGADMPWESGLYFAWGETSGYTADEVSGGVRSFNSDSYKWYSGSTAATKYNSSDGLTTIVPEDDAVTANWGGNWRMPTSQEFQMLGEAVDTAMTTNYRGSGASGLVLTDKTDSTKELFFPAQGYFGPNIHYSVVSYWSSSLSDTFKDVYAKSLYCRDGDINLDSETSRSNGLAVRGILDE